MSRYGDGTKKQELYEVLEYEIETMEDIAMLLEIIADITKNILGIW